MFIAALFAVAKRWKQPMCPSMDEQVSKLWYSHMYMWNITQLWKENPDTCYNMNEPCGHYAKWNKLVTKTKYSMTSLTWVIKFIGTEVEWRLPGAEGGRNRPVLFDEYRGLILQDEQGSGGWAPSSVNALNTAETHTHKTVKMLNFTVCVFYHN